jgi:peroxiredoxin
MSLINTTVKPFKTTAYHNGKFVPVSSEDLAGKWSVFVFYPADFTFVCPTELGDLADHYEEFKNWALKSTAFLQIHISPTKRGTTLLTLSAKSLTQCWAIQHWRFPATLKC